MKTWYHVWINYKVFGFCVDQGIIVDHPDYTWKYKTLEEYKPYLISQRAIVSKIADICQ